MDQKLLKAIALLDIGQNLVIGDIEDQPVLPALLAVCNKVKQRAMKTTVYELARFWFACA